MKLIFKDDAIKFIIKTNNSEYQLILTLYHHNLLEDVILIHDDGIHTNIFVNGEIDKSELDYVLSMIENEIDYDMWNILDGLDQQIDYEEFKKYILSNYSHLLNCENCYE